MFKYILVDNKILEQFFLWLLLSFKINDQKLRWFYFIYTPKQKFLDFIANCKNSNNSKSLYIFYEH